ncbi:Probable endonuclease LCL3 [Galdieria sulphuraria]|nr:Probable endonuclease LCL3 [Galdieria sulphuraria]
MNAFIVNWHWLSVAALTSASFGYLSATTKLLYMGVRRYKTAKDIPNSMFQRGSKIKGVVVSVGDGRHPVLKKRLSEETISVRLAGVDAPECAHFGAPGQEGGEQAKKWLRNYLKDRAVTVQLHSLDQYSRAVCTVHVRKGILRLKKNVSYELVKVGHAVVYRGFGAEYNGILRKLENAETEARKRKREP